MQCVTINVGFKETGLAVVMEASWFQVMLLGLTLILGSTEAMALVGRQSLLYLYDSNGNQMAEFNGTNSSLNQTNVGIAGAKVSTGGCFFIFNEEDFKGTGVKVESETSVTLAWNTVKSIKFMSSVEECSKSDTKGAGTSLFSSLGLTFVLFVLAFF